MSISYEKDQESLNYRKFSSEGENVLYSGNGNKQRAETFSNRNLSKTIHDTEGGRYLVTPNRYDVYNSRAADNLWSDYSKLHVVTMKGPVRTYVVGAKPDRVFRTTELGRALYNKDVPTINGMDRRKIQDFYKKELKEGLSMGMDRASALKYASDRSHRLISLSELRLNQREIRQGVQNPKQIRQHHESRQIYLAQKIDEAKARAKAMGTQYKGPELKPKQQRREDIVFKTNRDITRSKGLNEEQAKQYADKKLDQYKTQKQSRAEQDRSVRIRRNKAIAKHRQEVQSGRRDNPKDIRKQRGASTKPQNTLNAVSSKKTSSERRQGIRQFFAEHRVERAKAKEARKSGDLKPMQDANKKLADFKNKKRVEIAERNLKAIEQRNAQRHKFSQERKSKMAAFKQQKAQAELKGDRSTAREVRQQAKPVVQDLRAQNSKHAVQAQKDKKAKVQHEQRLAELKGQGQQKSQQQKQAQTSQYKSQVKDGTIRTQFTAIQSQDGGIKTRRTETARMVKDKSVQKINGYDRARFEKIFDRAYNTAIKRGASQDNARAAAKDRVSHVMGRVELRQDKAQMKNSGEIREKPIKAYFERDSQFKAQRVKDLQAQSSRENRAYKGPPQKPDALRQVETKISARDYTYRARLENNAKTEGLSASEYKAKSTTLESSLTKMRSQDLGSYFSQSHTAAQTYGYNSASFSQSKGTKGQNQSHNQTQGHSGRGMHH